MKLQRCMIYLTLEKTGDNYYEEIYNSIKNIKN